MPRDKLLSLLDMNLGGLGGPRRPVGSVAGWTPGTAQNPKRLKDMINAESALGRTLFGEIPAGHQREFFAAKKNVWIWHESWRNPVGDVEEMTIRYEVHPSGVYKRANQGNYEKIEGEELNNFRLAAQSYLKLIKQNLYY